jgi:predicted Zn-dependent protease
MAHRRFRIRLSILLLSVLGLGATGAAILSGCRAIEKGADALADATAGTGVSNILRGTARLAEGSRDYSPSEEHFIGRAVAAEILSRYKVHDDPSLNQYVNLVGLSVVYGAPEVRQTFSGYHFTILESDELNAVSAPGGFVFITLGTVRRAKNEDELAAVLAHEIAHVSLHHGIDAIQASTRKSSAALLLQGVGQTASAAARAGGSGRDAQLVELTGLFANAIQDITSELLVKGYSRKAELAADAQGAAFLKGSGYSRGALVSYLKRIGAEGGQGGWYGTHPAPEDRVKALGDAGVETSTAPAIGMAARAQRFRASAGAL